MRSYCVLDFLDSDEWQSTKNTPSAPPAKGRNSFPRPKHHSGAGNSSSSSHSAAAGGGSSSKLGLKTEPIDFEDPRSPFYLPTARTASITGIAGAAGDDEGDEEQFMNSQNSLLTTGGKGMFSRTGSINPHAYDDDTAFDLTTSSSISGIGTRSNSLKAALRDGLLRLSKADARDMAYLDEVRVFF